MTFLPIIGRELRAQARLGGTYGIRVLGVLVLLLVAFEFRGPHWFGMRTGGELFSQLHLALFCSIWIFVPLLSADCLSREKREGTLGLLFLTPLNARDIVLAKGLVHGLRALTLWLATAPMLTLPFLLGGVSWKEAVLSVLINFSCLCWALAAGLLGSALAKTWVRALLLACLGGLAGLAASMFLFGIAVATLLVNMGAFGFRGGIRFTNYAQMIAMGFYGATGLDGVWAEVLRLLPRTRHGLLFAFVGAAVVASLLVLWAAILLAAFFVRRGWQETPPAAWRTRLEQLLCTPVLGVSLLKRWQQQTLERNPVGWLERRTWSGRLVTWGWFAAVVTVSGFLLGASWSVMAFNWSQRWLAWLLLGSLAASAAGSFRRERESGVLELLLVSPRNEEQIITGRLVGIWSQFLPALLVLGGVWTSVSTTFQLRGVSTSLFFYFICFLTPAVTQ